ncbi:hypothetical protein CLOM_g19380 [Closterium sp. NIES-68]|nr:hypothetical protein CLOM_g19380 [Closterium sp. NIES-68]GJP76879.1 hypothetical protein CLOP_g7328 [Closterium sp. NIES-67]
MTANEASSQCANQKLTVFHGLQAPGIGLDKYLDRIFKYANCSYSCFVVAYIYVDRMIERQPDMLLTNLNIHRLLVTSVMVATKFFDDAYFNNAYYAKVGGVTTGEMNRLELEFLFRIDFRLNITSDDFASYCKLLEGELWRMQYPMDDLLPSFPPLPAFEAADSDSEGSATSDVIDPASELMGSECSASEPADSDSEGSESASDGAEGSDADATGSSDVADTEICCKRQKHCVDGESDEQSGVPTAHRSRCCAVSGVSDQQCAWTDGA